MHIPTDVREANADLIYRQLALELLKEHIQPAITLEETVNLTLTSAKTSLIFEKIEEVFKAKIRERKKTIEKVNREILSHEDSPVTSLGRICFKFSFSAEKWNEIYLNQILVFLLERFSVKYRGTLNAQGLNLQERDAYCKQITDFAIKLIQIDFEGSQIGSVIIKQKVEHLLKELYDEEISRLTDKLVKATLPNLAALSTKDYKKEILEKVKAQFPDHDNYEIVNHQFIKHSLENLISLEIQKELPEQTLRKFIKSHLDPYIKNPCAPQEPCCFSENCQAYFIKKHPLKSFQKQLVLEIYTTYLIDEMNENYAFKQFGTKDVRPLDPELRSDHCKKLLTSIQEAFVRDFKEISPSLPSPDVLQEKIQASLRALDIQAISFLAEYFLNTSFALLKMTLLEKPNEPFPTQAETSLKKEITDEIKKIFPFITNEEIQVQLPSMLPNKLKSLRLALAIWPELEAKIIPLMVDHDGFGCSKTEIFKQLLDVPLFLSHQNEPDEAKKEEYRELGQETITSLVKTFCLDLWNRCPPDEQDEMIDFIEKKIEILFTSQQTGPDLSPEGNSPLDSGSIKLKLKAFPFMELPAFSSPDLEDPFSSPPLLKR